MYSLVKSSEELVHSPIQQQPAAKASVVFSKDGQDDRRCEIVHETRGLFVFMIDPF